MRLEGVNAKLELWRGVLESKGFRISWTKTEYMECKFSQNRSRNESVVKIDNQDIPQSDHSVILVRLCTKREIL